MSHLNVPWQRWPTRYHALAAGLVVASAALIALLLLRGQQQALDQRSQDLKSLQSELRAIQQEVLPSSATDFTHALPRSARSDEVVRDMNRFAQSLSVQISSLNIQTQSASASELGQIQYHLTISADYRATKTWLAELLGRYASLAVHTLSIRAIANDPIRQEVRLTLVLFVKA